MLIYYIKSFATTIAIDRVRRAITIEIEIDERGKEIIPK